MKDDPVIALATTFGPILKAAFPNEHSVTRFQVANALAEAALALSLQDELVEALEAWEAWEAKVILDAAPWHLGGGFAITGSHYDRYIDLQIQRQDLLTRIKSERDGI